MSQELSKKDKDTKNANTLIERFPTDLNSTQEKSMFVSLLQDFMVDLKKFRIVKALVLSPMFVKFKVGMTDAELAGLANSFADLTGYQTKLCEDATRAVYDIFTLSTNLRNTKKGTTP